MTDENNPENGPESVQETPDPSAGTDTPGEGSGPENEPESFDRAYVVELRDEAATHRVRARDLEAEVGTLRERLLVDNVRHLAAAILADPADLTTFVDRDTLLDDDGHPDPDAILAAARGLARDRPHLASRRPTGPIEQGPRDEPSGVDLAGMLRTRAG